MTGTTALVAVLAAATWAPLHRPDLQVTSGAISPQGAGLYTGSEEMRAVARDGGHHATDVRLRFRYLGPSAKTKPLASGEVHNPRRFSDGTGAEEEAAKRVPYEILCRLAAGGSWKSARSARSGAERRTG